jgi:hypothetical protein
MKNLWKDSRLLTTVAAVLALVGLALTVVSVLIPRPLPVVVAMTVGQGFGTLSLLLFVRVVWLSGATSRGAS